MAEVCIRQMVEIGSKARHMAKVGSKVYGGGMKKRQIKEK